MAEMELFANQSDLELTADNSPEAAVKIYAVGASNLRKICKEINAKLFRKGYKVVDICSPGWKCNKSGIFDLKNKIKNVVKDTDIFLFDPLANNMWFDLAGPPPITRSNGVTMYHFREPVVTDVKRRDGIFRAAETVIGWLPSNTRVLLSAPVPRFVTEPCCEVEHHMANREKVALDQFGKAFSYLQRFAAITKRVGHWVRTINYDQMTKISPREPEILDFYKNLLKHGDQVHLNDAGVEFYSKVYCEVIEDWEDQFRRSRSKRKNCGGDLRQKIRSGKSDKSEVEVCGRGEKKRRVDEGKICGHGG